MKKLDKQFALISEFDHHFINQTGGDDNECEEIENTKNTIINRITNLTFPTIDFKILDNKIIEIKKRVIELETQNTLQSTDIGNKDNEIIEKSKLIQEYIIKINQLEKIKEETKENCNEKCKKALQEIEGKLDTMENEHIAKADELKETIQKTIQNVPSVLNASNTSGFSETESSKTVLERLKSTASNKSESRRRESRRRESTASDKSEFIKPKLSRTDSNVLKNTESGEPYSSRTDSNASNKFSRQESKSQGDDTWRDSPTPK
jgi:hypothetical protein